MALSDRRFSGWNLLRLGAIGLAVVLGLGLAYKAKRVLQINLFPGIDMVPDEQLKAVVLWVLRLLLWPFRKVALWVLPD